MNSQKNEISNNNEIQERLTATEKKLRDKTIQLKEIRDQLEDRDFEFKALVKELKQKNLQLKETQDQLIQTEKMAALGEIAGKIAHEVLNPITAALMRVEFNIKEEKKADSTINIFSDIIVEWQKKFNKGILEKFLQQKDNNKTYGEEDFEILLEAINNLKKKEKERKKDLNFLNVHLNRIVRIVNSLRALSRKSRLVENLEISIPIKESLDLMRDTIKKREVEIKENYPDSIPKVRADCNELIQIFSNLIRNSLQAIEEIEDKRKGHISINVKTTPEKIEIRFIDNGTGIPNEYKDHIFDRSFTTKNREQGTGVGLSMCRGLIHENNGDIILEKAEEKKGAVFLITLPIIKE